VPNVSLFPFLFPFLPVLPRSCSRRLSASFCVELLDANCCHVPCRRPRTSPARCPFISFSLPPPPPPVHWLTLPSFPSQTWLLSVPTLTMTESINPPSPSPTRFKRNCPCILLPTLASPCTCTRSLRAWSAPLSPRFVPSVVRSKMPAQTVKRRAKSAMTRAPACAASSMALARSASILSVRKGKRVSREVLTRSAMERVSFLGYFFPYQPVNLTLLPLNWSRNFGYRNST
jgi:hypothetical protein